MSDFRIFGPEFENIIDIFEISVHNFALLQSLVQNWRFFNLGPKMPYLGIFEREYENNIELFEISTLEYV